MCTSASKALYVMHRCKKEGRRRRGFNGFWEDSLSLVCGMNFYRELKGKMNNNHVDIKINFFKVH